MLKRPGTGHKSARILIVEDNPESIDLLVYFLKPAGYEIMTAQDGLSAIEIVEKDPPDLILLDIMLPRLDGFQVCERLKKNEHTFHIPIIMITALKELKDKIRALEAGADDFVSKPFDSIELLARVKSLLRLKFYHDELIRRNQELERQKRMLLREDQLKKELTHLIVHDMKNPLFVIQGNLQMMHMQKQAGSGESDEKYTRRIERSSRGLLRMILNLLDISRLEQRTLDIEPIPVPLKTLIMEVVEYFRDMPEHASKTVEFRLPENLPEAYVDQEVFERILDNLMNYVFQNTPEYMQITVKAETGEDGYNYLKIFHQGTPIPKQYAEKVFKKYAQSELKKAGIKPARGLGLIFCKLAMEAHHGDIRLIPVEDQGNCFILKIPTLKAHSYLSKKEMTTSAVNSP
ncbi:MAG: hybrid sensor histidine kinase/response regulator [Calditrichaeota bacterium]|nr:MAG: hybrid sensor histidine kinase/response regulator [Calditrichota bacterium]